LAKLVATEATVAMSVALREDDSDEGVVAFFVFLKNQRGLQGSPPKLVVNGRVIPLPKLGQEGNQGYYLLSPENYCIPGVTHVGLLGSVLIYQAINSFLVASN
jgi:hypothetical protein